MLKPQEQAASHVDLFIERYERLFLWSLQLTENDQQQAEDLLHDAFIQFTLGQADLNSIQNLEGYLRTMLNRIEIGLTKSELDKGVVQEILGLLLIVFGQL